MQWHYMTVLSIYAPTKPSNSTSEAAHPSEAFYDQLQCTYIFSIPSSDMLVIIGDFNSLGPIRFFHVIIASLRHDVINIINISGVNGMG